MMYNIVAMPTVEGRYMIIDETGTVLDDAQGWGYKDKEKARKAFTWKLNQMDSKSIDSRIRTWLKKNRLFYQILLEIELSYVKENKDFYLSKEAVGIMINEANIKDFPVIARDFANWWNRRKI